MIEGLTLVRLQKVKILMYWSWLVKDYSTPATEFSNVEYDGATKNSNSDNSVNVIKLLQILSNISLEGAIEQKNFNISNQTSYFPEWAGSDSNQRPPPCQGGILTRLDHRPLYYNY